MAHCEFQLDNDFQFQDSVCFPWGLSVIAFLFILWWTCFSSLTLSWSFYASGTSQSPWKGCCPSRVSLLGALFSVVHGSHVLDYTQGCHRDQSAWHILTLPGAVNWAMVPCAAAQPCVWITQFALPHSGGKDSNYLCLHSPEQAAFISPELRGITF